MRVVQWAAVCAAGLALHTPGAHGEDAAAAAAAKKGNGHGKSKYNYIPVFDLTDYLHEAGREVEVNVNSLHSHEALVSYDFFSLKYCKPSDKAPEAAVPETNYGQILWGEHIEKSPWRVTMMQNEKCRPVKCPGDATNTGKVTLTAADMATFDHRIQYSYRGNFVIDNLPVVNSGVHHLLGREKVADCRDSAPRGWPVGVSKKCTGSHNYINNHLLFKITVNEHQKGEYIIVRVRVAPQSIDWEKAGIKTCGADFDASKSYAPLTTEKASGKVVHWTYGVEWSVSKDLTWSNRWDEYLSSSIANVSGESWRHWYSILNSLLIVLCLSAIVAMILLRTLHMDFNRYNNPESADEQAEEMGWKLVHADVFRPPPYSGLFSVIIGTGTQLIGMFVLSLLFAYLGFLSPANRGGLITATIFLFVLMAIANGMVTGVCLNMFDNKRWKLVFVSGLLYPGVLFTLWILMELYINASRQGANTAPIFKIVQMMGLWFCVSLPLVVLGAGFGFGWLRINPVTKFSKLPRQVPPQRWYFELPILLIVPGLIPFCAAFVELRFILLGMWQGMVYYVFGFLAISSFTVLLAAAEVTLVIVYFMLVFEDYRWWWRSIIIPGGMGFWVFLYSIYYYKTVLTLKTNLAAFIFFETMACVSASVFVVAGTIGFVSSLIFVRAIYSRIKID
eukprot:Rhum_TRINITY_DN13446_c1_g1::Rhum_TRINITY_DN13446_c1_g1_i1::g.60474::m.60474/K17086/TM9SF2_4; transmembrane 9 superfamily member 2/4